jgi:hypothetical protein
VLANTLGFEDDLPHVADHRVKLLSRVDEHPQIQAEELEVEFLLIPSAGKHDRGHLILKEGIASCLRGLVQGSGGMLCIVLDRVKSSVLKQIEFGG